VARIGIDSLDEEIVKIYEIDVRVINIMLMVYILAVKVNSNNYRGGANK